MNLFRLKKKMAFSFTPTTGKIISIVLWLAILGYAWSIRELFQPLIELPTSTIAALLLLTTLQLGLQTVLLPLMLSCLGTQLSWRTWLPVGILSGTANMLLPAQGGTVLKSLYLKKQHDIDYSSSAAIAGFQLIIRLSCFTLVALVALSVYLYKQNSDYLPYPLIILLVLPILLTLAWHFQQHLIARVTQPWLKSLATAFFQLARNRRLLASSALINLSILVSNALLFAILFTTFNVPVSVELIMLYTSLKFISLVINIIPGNMGISELLSGFFTSLLHGNFEAGVAAALTARGVALLVSLLSAAIVVICTRNRAERNID